MRVIVSFVIKMILKKFLNLERQGIEAPFELYTAKGDATGEVQIPIKYIDKMEIRQNHLFLLDFLL